MQLLNLLITEEDGQTLVEYGLLISFLCLTVITALAAVSKHMNKEFKTVSKSIPVKVPK